MGIVLKKAPEAGRSAVGKALRDLRHGKEHAATSLLGGGSISLSEPLPVYRLGLSDIKNPDGLNKAQHVGWRYLVEGAGGSAAFADVKGVVHTRFSSLSDNENATRLVKAASLSQAVAANLPEDYEVRILDVPALYISTIWLTANGINIFIPYLDRKRRKGHQVRVEPEFLAELVSQARTVKPSDAPSVSGGIGSKGERSRSHGLFTGDEGRAVRRTGRGRIGTIEGLIVETRSDALGAALGAAGEVRETHNLIASDRVEGTPVRRSDGEKIGTIERVMIEKRSGKVAYAVIGFGGFMGLGEDYYTLPWSVLKYNTQLDAYELNLTEDQIRGAPRRSLEGRDASYDRAWEEHVHRYYNATPYWGI